MALPAEPPIRPWEFLGDVDGRIYWKVEETERTPSRSDGICGEEERAERFKSCTVARNIVRGLFSDTDDERLQEVSRQAQCVACYCLQQFFMFRSMKQEDARVVAVASAFAACKVVDSPRRMREVLRTNNQLRVKHGDAELGEEEQRSLHEKILKLEEFLLRIIRFATSISPCAFIRRTSPKC